MSRREQILGTAASLFAARGFHGVSVAELGAACGISGPALYKHFPSKDAMLAEMLVSISEELLRVGRERSMRESDPHRALAALPATETRTPFSIDELPHSRDKDRVTARAIPPRLLGRAGN